MIGWNSRRSAVLSTKGISSSSQPLASQAGIQILQQGGNAADAAVAMAAVLNLTEPCSTGIGGDAFALYYEAKTKKVHCLQGNGASAGGLTLEYLHSIGIGVGEGLSPWNNRSGLCVTIPGAAALWEDFVQQHGKLPLEQVLAPAIHLAENGFPISPITAEHWAAGFLQGEEAQRVYRPNNTPVIAGQIFKNPDLANTFRSLAQHGAKKGFYSGPIAEAIVEAVKDIGGIITLDDLQNHSTALEEPISTVYKGIRIYQTPPPSHGLSVLLALNFIQAIEQQQQQQSKGNPTGKDVYEKEDFNFQNPNLAKRANPEEIHLVVESMRRAYADGLEYIGDPRTTRIPLNTLLSPEYAQFRSHEISLEKTTPVQAGNISFFLTGETVYFSVIDAEGNACSFINSNYMGFGTGVVPKNTGFTLQNRGHNFSLVAGHPNQVEPNKRPYHTIIPALGTYESDGSLYGVFGNMGGFMQPMGHVQLIRNLIDHRLNPQQAVDAPRWYIVGTGKTQSSSDMLESELLFEEGYGNEKDVEEYSQQEGNTNRIIEVLREKGHKIGNVVKDRERVMYGKAQVILKDPKTGVLWGGADPRSDGCAIPLL